MTENQREPLEIAHRKLSTVVEIGNEHANPGSQKEEEQRGGEKLNGVGEGWN